MFKFFNLKIFQKILIIIIITLIPYIILSFIFIKDITEEKKILNFQEKNIILVQKLSSLILNIQKERGLFFSYLNNAQNEEILKTQISQNNRLFENIKTEIDNKKIVESIDKINIIRKIEGNEEPLKMFISYTEVINDLMDHFVYIINQKTTRGIGKLLSTISFLEEGKEGLAQLRGITSGILAKNKPLSLPELKIVINSYNKFSAIILNPKNLLLTERNIKKIKEIEKNENIEKIFITYNTIIEKKYQGNFNIDPNENFNNMTEIINLIQSIIDDELNEIHKKNIEFIKSADNNIKINILLLVITLIISGSLSYFIAKSITNPLKMVSLSLHNISKGEGDLTSKIKIVSKDEAGIISEAFNEFLEKLRLMVENIKKQAKILVGVSGELSVNTHETSANLNEISANSKNTLSNVKNGRDSIINSIKIISEIIEEIKKIDKMTEEMKNQLSNVSSAIEEMSANIASSSNMTSKAAASSENLEKVSIEGKNSIEKLSSSIKEVSLNSENIVEMLKLIMDIAEQTNLLAMNAAIEAAHAGEYGKGFAVVAEEIRKLADKSSRSAKDIQNIVKTISENIKKTLELSEKANQGFLLLGQEISKVKQINYEIASAMEEQKIANNSILKSTTELNRISDAIFEKVKEEVNKGNNLTKTLESVSVVINEITNSVEEQKNAIEDTTKATESIKNIAKELKDIAIKINEDFNRFKT